MSATTGAHTASTGSAAEFELAEWSVKDPSTVAAGQVTFKVSNVGKFPHEMIIVKGDSFESLAKDAAGKVLEDSLPAGAFIGEVESMEPGVTEEYSADLAAGTYLLMCNLVSGGASHGSRGQVAVLSANEPRHVADRGQARLTRSSQSLEK